MKTTILGLVLVLSTLTGFAQGRISIANDSGRLFEIGVPQIPGDPTGPIPNGPLPSYGQVIFLALYAGTSAGSLTLQTSYAVTGSNFLSPGRTATKPMTLTGVPGGVPQFFNIVLTDSAILLPNSIDGTRVGGSQSNGPGIGWGWLLFPTATYLGSSGLFQFTPSTSAIAAPPINGPGTTWLAGSVYLSTIPEPSSLMLFGVAGGAIILFRRRWPPRVHA